MRAPAATTRGAVSASMPPSISIGAAVLPDRSSSARTARHLGLAARDESLAAEPGVHRHHEHEVDVARDLLERADRRRWVQHDARP